MKTARHFLVSAALLALTGCASSGKFACSAPDGVSCYSTPQIYRMTDDAASLQASSVEAGRKSRSRGARGKVATHQVGATGDALALSAPVQNPRGSVQPAALSLGGQPGAATGLMPVGGSEVIARVPARVMRIWVAPWTDSAGDLHMPGYVYSEIAGRRWSIGGDVRMQAPSSFDPDGPWLPTAAPTAHSN